MKTAFESEGDLRGVDVLAALVTLWRESSAGSLRVERPGSQARFDIAGGEVLGVSSSDHRFETSAILVRAGKLDAAALDRLVAPEGRDRALAALAAGILTKREWRWGEKIRAIEILSDLLMWTEGSCAFDSSARPAGGELRLPIPRLLLELFLRSRDRGLIEHQLGPVDAPLVRSENFEQEFAGFGLTADAESVVGLIDGRATAAEIAERAPADEFAVQKLLASLVTLGLVRPVYAAEEAASPSAFPEPAGEPEIFESRAGGKDESAEIAEFAPAADHPFPDSYDELPREAEPLETAGFEVPREVPSPAEEEEAFVGWERAPGEPLDRTLEMPVEPAEPSASRGRGALLAWLVGLLGVGVAAAIFFWPRPPGRPVAGEPTPVAGAAAFSPAPEPAAPPSPAPSPMAIEEASQPSGGAARPAPSPGAAPAAKARPTPASVAEGSQERWLGRAARDRRRLASEPRTRYAIQLELACEVSTLEKAWRYDRPSGRMWLLPSTHAGRTCFKVLWGRYASLEAARNAKSGVPVFFSTGGNRPAVVAVR